MSSPIPSISTQHSILRPQLLSSTTPSMSVRIGAERIPIAAIGHTRRASGVGEAAVQKESMNCKSCRKKKIKCNRMHPSCGACLAFQCACIYDAIPKKRGPKTEVVEELLKRVSGLEKRLAEEQEANIAKKLEDIKASNGGLPATESTTDQDQEQQSLEWASVGSQGVPKRGEVSAPEILKADYERGDARGATNINLRITSARGSDHDSEPPPYASLSPIPATLVTDFSNSWASPIKIMDTQPSAMKRRRTSDAQTPSKSLGVTGIPFLEQTRSITSHLHLESTQDNVHHSIQFPDSYIDAFFREFHGRPHEVLHEETFRASFAQGAIYPSQLHIVCAIGAKYVHPGPRGHSLCVRFTEAARAAVDMDFPSLENFQTLLLISISYFYLGKGYKTFMLLGTAVRMAYGLDLNRELPPDEPATPVEREVRRRAFWACYLLDRFAVCGSRRPPMLLEESILLKLPGSMPQMSRGLNLDEQFLSSRMGLAGPGAGESHVGGLLAPRRQAESASALCIDVTKLLGTTVRYIEQGGVKADIHFPWHAQSSLTKIRRELEHWAARTLTCELYSQTPGAAPGDGLYLRHPDVTLLVMAKAIFHLVSCLIYRPFLAVELGGNSRRAHQGMGDVTADGPEASHGGQQQIWQAEATKMCFVHANAIGDLVEVLKSTKPEGFQWPAILGYCVVTAATIHLHGAYYQNTERDPVLRTSKGYLDLEMQHIRDFRDKWPAARVQYVMLKRLKKAHEELVQRLAETSSLHTENNYCGIAGGLDYSSGTGYWAGYTGKQNVFHLDDFFQRYPNREKYFDGAQCPFVEDMIETAAKLSLNDELEHPDISQTQVKIEKIAEGFTGAAPPHAFTSGDEDGCSVPQDIQHHQQYGGAQTYSASNSHQEKRTWDPNRQKGQGSNPCSISSDTSAGAFDYLCKHEVQSPSSPTASTCTISPSGRSGLDTPKSTPVAGSFDTTIKTEGYDIFPVHTSPDLISGYPLGVNLAQHTVPQIASYSPSDPSLTSTRSTHSNPFNSQETFHSAELNTADWFARENSASLDTSQNFNTRIRIHSGNPNHPAHGGDVHTGGHNVQGEIYIDHSSPTLMETGNLPDEGHIRDGDFGRSGAQLKYVEQPDPFLLMLTQMVEERNNSYGNLGQHSVMHSGPGEASTHMRTASESEMSSAEAGIIRTSNHAQPMGTGLHFGSHTQIDPTRPTAVNKGAGMVTEGYSGSWVQHGVYF